MTTPAGPRRPLLAADGKGIRFLFAVFSVLFVSVVFWINYQTSERLSIYLFYFPFIIGFTWMFGTTGAVLSVAVSSVAWFLGTYLDPARSGMGLLLWNTAVRFLTFSIVAWAVGTFLKKQKQLETVQKQLRGLLEMEKKLSRQDSLTGAYNSRAFHERFSEERHRRTRYHHDLTLLYFDLDDFKGVNDLHGHLFGDNLLKKVVLAMHRAIREVDLIARVGGDEFVIMLPETGLEGALQCARRVMTALVEELASAVTVSIGIVACGPETETNEEIIQRADRAMYRAKQSGKNKIFIER